MKVNAKLFTAAALSAHPLAALFKGAKKGRASGLPSAEFTPVPAARQERVTRDVQRALTAKLEGKVPADRRAAVSELMAHVGQSDFYETLARHDSKAMAPKWREMAQVQRDFAAVEPQYDEVTRAYSESMRLTLHASVVQHFALDPRPAAKPLYETFIELHPTAFHQNGGWVDNLQIPMSGAMAVAVATPAAMWLNAVDLTQGALLTDERTIAAAELVRSARREALKGWR